MARWSSPAWEPGEITDIASSTITGTFDITRTTGTSSGRCFSTKDVRTPAAKVITRSPGVTCSRICDSRVSMSWGLAISTRTSAHPTASALSSVAATPYLPASSRARSSRRFVTMISSAVRPPDRISPEMSASPIFPPPRKATLRCVDSLIGSSLAGRRPGRARQVRQEEPHVRGTFGEPAGQVGIPLGAIRDVHPEGIPAPGQPRLQIPAHTVQHLELDPRPAVFDRVDPGADAIDQPRVMRGDVDRVTARQQRAEQPREGGINVVLVLVHDMRRLEV